MRRANLEARSRAAARWYPLPNRRLVASVLGSFKLVVDAEDLSLTPHLVLDGFWESWITLWFQANVRPGDRLLNVGANCGYYAVLAATQGAEVVAVEPQPRLAEGIEMSAVLNGVDGRLLVRRCVASDCSETVRLQMHGTLTGSAFVGDAADGFDQSMDVRAEAAHELMPEANCVFVDAEGHEPRIWDGLRPLLDGSRLKWVALEWAPTRYEDAESFARQLLSAGSVCAVTTDGSERPVTLAQMLAPSSGWDTIVVRPSM